MAPEYFEVGDAWVDPKGGGSRALPGWSDGGAILPDLLYRFTGDESVVADNLSSMLRWVNFQERRAPDGIWRVEAQEGGGDWLNIEQETAPDLFATLYMAWSAAATARCARALQDTAAAEALERRVEVIRRAFNARFVGDGGLRSPTQTACALVLRLGLLDATAAAETAEWLSRDVAAAGHLRCGIHGARHILPVLTATGNAELAYSVATSRQHPALGWHLQSGATTMPERWDARDAEGVLYHNAASNSMNHCALGSVTEWLYEDVGGVSVDPAAPGFRRIRIAPRPGGDVTWAETSYRSVLGEVGCRWKLEPDRFILDAFVPPGATAIVRVPASDSDAIREKGSRLDRAVGVTAITPIAGATLVAVASGSYSFTAAPVSNIEGA